MTQTTSNEHGSGTENPKRSFESHQWEVCTAGQNRNWLYMEKFLLVKVGIVGPSRRVVLCCSESQRYWWAGFAPASLFFGGIAPGQMVDICELTDKQTAEVVMGTLYFQSVFFPKWPCYLKPGFLCSWLGEERKNLWQLIWLCALCLAAEFTICMYLPWRSTVCFISKITFWVFLIIYLYSSVLHGQAHDTVGSMFLYISFWIGK